MVEAAKPDQHKQTTNDIKAGLYLIPGGQYRTPEEAAAEYSHVLLDGLFDASYDQRTLESRLEELKQDEFSRLKLTNTLEDGPLYILHTILNHLHATPTDEHQSLMDGIISEAADILKNFETKRDSDALIDLRDQIGEALLKDYADINSVRLLEMMRHDQYFTGQHDTKIYNGMVGAYRLIGLSLIIADQKYRQPIEPS